MKAVLEFELPESCIECPIRFVNTNTHKLYCGFGAVEALFFKKPDEIVANHIKMQFDSNSVLTRALNCPLKIVEDSSSEAIQTAQQGGQQNG